MNALSHQLTRRFHTIAAGARMLPGVHRYCDAWCDYCRVRERCLAFRCRQEFCRVRRLRHDQPLPPDDAREFARTLSHVDDPVVADACSHVAEMHDDAAVVSLALHYRRRSALLVDEGESGAKSAKGAKGCKGCGGAQRALFAPFAPIAAFAPRAGEPPARDAVLRFHSAIYFKTTRALVRRAMAASGLHVGEENAISCAAQTLSYARRSRAGLAALPDGGERRAVVMVLDELVRRLDERFPGAVALSRLSIDAPALTKNTHGSNPREI